MSDGWVTVTLSEVLKPESRLELVTEQDSVPYAGVRWYAQGVYRRPAADPSAVKAKKLSRLHSGDITYNRMWATKAAFGVVGPEADGCLVTNDFPVFVAQSSLIPQFMAFVFQTSQFQSAASLLAVGTTERRRLKAEDFLTLEIPLPPIPVQRRIVDLMTHLDAHIANLRAEREATNALLDSLRHSFLGNLAVDGNLEKVVTTARAGGTPDRKNLDFYGGDIPWLKSGEVGGSTIQETEESITLAGLEHSSAWLVPADTTLVAMYGATAGVVGYTAIPLTTNQAVLALVADSKLADSRFLFHWMTFLSPQLKAASTGAAQANLSKQVILRESGFPDINVDEQSQIASLLDSTVNKADCLKGEQLRLTELRKCLLADLLSGTEELDDAYDSILSKVA